MFEIPKNGGVDSAFLPEETAEVFDMLATWLYRGTLQPIVIIVKHAVSTRDHAGIHSSPSQRHFRLYYLAEKWAITRLQNCVMDELHGYFNQHSLAPAAGRIKDVYAMTPKSSPLRKLIVRQAAWKFSFHGAVQDIQYARDILKLREEFLMDLLEHLRAEMEKALTTFSNPRLEPSTVYHKKEVTESTGQEKEGG